MKLRTFGQIYLMIGLLVTAPACLRAADFEVLVAKGVEMPVGTKRGSKLNSGQKIFVGTAGLFIARQLRGCSGDVVAVGPQLLTLQLACIATIDEGALGASISTGEPLLGRIAFTGDAKADEFHQSYNAYLQDACVRLPEVSEDKHKGSARCPSGYLVSGVSCSGAYCDNLRLRCCPYLEGNADPGMNNYGSKWISEETAAYSTKNFVNGLSCRGSYCDDLFPHTVESPRFENAGSCSWTPSFSEESPSRANCPKDHFVSGMRCTGRYCDNLSLQCCSLKTRPSAFDPRTQRPLATPAN